MVFSVVQIKKPFVILVDTLLPFPHLNFDERQPLGCLQRIKGDYGWMDGWMSDGKCINSSISCVL